MSAHACAESDSAQDDAISSLWLVSASVENIDFGEICGYDFSETMTFNGR
jgi:hypothetical protein